MNTTHSTTPPQDHPTHIFRRRSHPRVFVSLCGGTILIILFLHGLLILYPTYQSGIYRSDNPDQETFVVPFYTNPTPGFRNSTDSIWVISAIVSISIMLIFPQLSIALLVVLIRKWRLFNVRERVFWVAAMIIIWLAFIITFPAAAKFYIWFAD